MPQSIPTDSLSHILALFNPEDWIMEVAPTEADLASKIASIKTLIEQMDIDALEQLLKIEQKFSAKDLAILKYNLITAFVIMKGAGDTALNGIECNCTSCYPNKCGFIFVGNVSKMYFNFSIYSEENYMLYMKECSNFETKQGLNGLGEKIDLPISRLNHEFTDGKLYLKEEFYMVVLDILDVPNTKLNIMVTNFLGM